MKNTDTIILHVLNENRELDDEDFFFADEVFSKHHPLVYQINFN